MSSNSNARSGVGGSNRATVRKVRTSSRSTAAWSKVLVSLRVMEDVRSGEGRTAQYNAMRTLARERRAEVLNYLREHAEPDAWRKPGEVTSFGTFTVDCRPSGLRVLRHAPHVESVVPVGSTPMRVIR
jgi:hypothetical protein